jgi:hypothetical protein
VDTRGSGNGTQFKSTHLVNRISVGANLAGAMWPMPAKARKARSTTRIPRRPSKLDSKLHYHDY